MMTPAEQAAWDDGFQTACRWMSSAAEEAAKMQGTTIKPPIGAVVRNPRGPFKEH